ncbi:hypothetical protein AA0114_g8636 [Alternaria tenuissima]|uniref:Uncharacterized protein n=1 Tax=Alternaria tenuissima TaxID=119927 RepID=A0A4Q4MA68_9PLEO|nr:hypothetical protein AA0114_g8636 [Alternaria tenuissima]
MKTFADLPTEMVVNVFKFVRQRPDQGAVCLVSRLWRKIMAPVMWEKLETNLRESGSRSLGTLLKADSNILPHVRELKICSVTFGHDMEDRLKLLIAALPRDKLRTIHCTYYIKDLTFQQLLLSQRKLESIQVATSFTNLDQRTESHFLSHDYFSWTASMMSEVKQIKFDLFRKENGQARKTLKILRKAFDACSKLENLILIDTRAFPGSLQDILSYATGGQLFFQLTSVTLQGLDLVPNGSQPFCHNFNVTNLQQMNLTSCDDVIPFLDSLTRSYSEMSGALKVLSIQLREDDPTPVETASSVEGFLKACPKLKDLSLVLARCPLVGKDCLLSHADTLRSLVVSTDPLEQRAYSKHDLERILKACKRLKCLAINFPPIRLGSVTKPRQGLRFDESEDGAEGVLAQISRYSSLHTLGMLNLPELRFAYYPKPPRLPTMTKQAILQSYNSVMQSLANQVFCYMAQHGTSPKVFHVEADGFFWKLSRPDRDFVVL